MPVLDYLPVKVKIARVYASTPMMEAGRVWLPKNKIWADDLFSECMSFPNGSHDDQVDCLSMAINYMKDSWNLTHPEDPSWEDDGSKKDKRVAYWRV